MNTTRRRSGARLQGRLQAEPVVRSPRRTQYHRLDIGLTRKQVHEARQLRDACRDQGELLALMKARGERHRGHGDQKSKSRAAVPIPKLAELRVSKTQSITPPRRPSTPACRVRDGARRWRTRSTHNPRAPDARADTAQALSVHLRRRT